MLGVEASDNHLHGRKPTRLNLIKEDRMLVLSRKRNEQILIDGNITIEVLQVKGNTVRLGISAPRDVKVLRGELKPFGVQVIEAELPASMPIA
jgi:carbon storage regulator CsrA